MDWSESGYIALSALNVKDGYIDFSQDVHYGNQELYDKWMVGKELHKGQVLFTTEAPMGNVAQVPDNKGYILSQRTIAFDVNESVISENFLATLLRTPNVFNDLTALSSGGTAKGVSQKSLSGLDVIIPKNIDEQNKLAGYFINIDNLITLENHKSKIEQEILRLCKPYETILSQIRSVPGFDKNPMTAIGLLSEIGPDMSVFPSAKNLVSWAGCCPHNDSSAHKVKSTRISRSCTCLKPLLVQIANALVKSKNHPEFTESD